MIHSRPFARSAACTTRAAADERLWQQSVATDRVRCVEVVCEVGAGFEIAGKNGVSSGRAGGQSRATGSVSLARRHAAAAGGSAHGNRPNSCL